MDRVSDDTSTSDGGIATFAAQIYKTLFHQIVTGELSPGQRLEEKILAAQFNVSRTPVREALRELAARELVELTPRRGVEVTQMGIERLADMLEGECELEGLCARLASQHMTALEKRQLQDVHERAEIALQSDDVTTYFDLNTLFHSSICAGAHNLTLKSMVQDLRQRLSPFRRPATESESDKMRRSHREHQAIVDAILKGQTDAAYLAVRDHNARINSNVIKLLRAGRKF